MDRLPLRIAAAVLLAAGGVIHLKLYRDGYRHIDDVGRSFLLNAVASFVVAVAVVVWRHWLPLVAGLLITNMTLIAFGLSRTDRGVFDFREFGFEPSPEAVLSLIVEIAAAVLFVLLLATPASAAATTPSPAAPSPPR